MAVLGLFLTVKLYPHFQVFNVEVGDKAPDFSLTSDDGRGVSMADYRGTYVLLNFWATWCAPCVDELPSLVALHDGLSDKGFVVLGLSVDHDEKSYRQFVESFDISFPTVRDPGMTVSTKYGTNKFPESYLIDREGVVRRKYVGPENWTSAEIVNYLRSLL
jgi:peroxiredoxin